MDLVTEVESLVGLADYLSTLSARAVLLEDHASATTLQRRSDDARHLADYVRALARQMLSAPTPDELGV